MLKQLLKYTPEDHPDKNLIVEAIDRIEAVATQNEKVQERSENISILFSLESRFQQELSIQLVEPHRQFILQGRVVVHRYNKDNSIKDVKARKRYHLLLFNDMLVMAKPKKDSSPDSPDSDKEDSKDKEKDKEKEKEDLEKAKKKQQEEETGQLRFVRHLELKECEVEEEPSKDAPKHSYRLQHLVYPFCFSFPDGQLKEKWWNETRQAIAEDKKKEK